MIQPARIDIAADRWVACIRTISFVALDFTGATFVAQVRMTPDLAGTPLISLATVGGTGIEGIHLLYAGLATVSAHIGAGRLEVAPSGYELTDNIFLSQLWFRINETSMEALPLPAEVGDDLELAWDMHITPLGGIKDKYAGGQFVVRAGVTQ